MRKVKNIRETQGKKGFILYLKASSVALQQAASGHCHIDCIDLGARISRTKVGLPRLIPANHRIFIKNRNMGYTVLIRFYLTVFSMYRVVPLLGKPKLNTIYDPGKYFNISRFESKIERFLHLFIKDKTKYLIPRFYLEQKAKFFSIFRSSPQTSLIRAVPKAFHDLRFKMNWSSNPVSVLESVAIWFGKSSASLLPIIEEFSNSYFKNLWFLFKQLKDVVKDDSPNLGRFAFKEEAAGKVRVFALVDVITQWLLAPLHKYLFSILRNVPMDGTFNQLKPVYRLLNYSRRYNKPLYSLDLTAATDRLPVSIQARLLDLLIQEIPNFGQKWAALLTNRWYHIPHSEQYGAFYNKGQKLSSIKYAVGQPMGALSSWAMLALTHHFIVQMAAWDAGFPQTSLFKAYAVLGDDLVIGNTKVTKAYLKILDELGVECGLHKSILSPKGLGLEFAKSTFIDGVNCSPLSLKELQSSLSDLASWSAFVKKWNLSFYRQAHCLGFGYLARRKSFKKLNHALQLVYLSLILKSDFNSDVLKLRRGNKLVDFDKLHLDLFMKKVITPLKKEVWKMLQNFNNFDLTTIVKGISINPKTWSNPNFEGNPEKDLFNNWTPNHFLTAYRTTSFTIINSIMERLSKTYDLFRFPQFIKTFDKALGLYLKVHNAKAVASLSFYTLKGDIRLPNTKLPFQARMFRAWSRVSHSVLKEFRKENALILNQQKLEEVSKASDDGILKNKSGPTIVLKVADKASAEVILGKELTGLFEIKELNERS